MTSRERELLDATKNVFIVQCLCDPTVPGLDRLASAIDAYATTPQQDHERCLANRLAEDEGASHARSMGIAVDAPLPSAGHMNLANAQVEDA